MELLLIVLILGVVVTNCVVMATIECERQRVDRLAAEVYGKLDQRTLREELRMHRACGETQGNRIGDLELIVEDVREQLKDVRNQLEHERTTD